MLGGQSDHAGFEQEPSKAEHVGPSASSHRFGQPGGRVDRNGQLVEILDGQRRRRPTREGHSQLHCSSHRHSRRRGAETAGGVLETGDVVGEQHVYPAEHAVPEVLGEQQLHVGPDRAGHDRVGDEGPGQFVTMQLDQPGVDRSGHPLVKVRVPGKERLGCCPSLEPIGPLTAEVLVVFDEDVEQAGTW